MVMSLMLIQGYFVEIIRNTYARIDLCTLICVISQELKVCIYKMTCEQPWFIKQPTSQRAQLNINSYICVISSTNNSSTTSRNILKHPNTIFSNVRQHFLVFWKHFADHFLSTLYGLSNFNEKQ